MQPCTSHPPPAFPQQSRTQRPPPPHEKQYILGPTYTFAYSPPIHSRVPSSPLAHTVTSLAPPHYPSTNAIKAVRGAPLQPRAPAPSSAGVGAGGVTSLTEIAGVLEDVLIWLFRLIFLLERRMEMG
ncbi:hypothetical protein BS50DRAFT_191276 [Corynespora cassiicola Philippines]|uniref:Uncharacterized protein n=1 Tax=Corynespora cassiicola Philippines TaxID=1448308 RepID=A0A2T2P7D7_CORCC|nr:hypothetical protein BS50DRAFT_191276 [Corynespora cassiicola Philippines]